MLFVFALQGVAVLKLSATSSSGDSFLALKCNRCRQMSSDVGSHSQPLKGESVESHGPLQPSIFVFSVT